MDLQYIVEHAGGSIPDEYRSNSELLDYCFNQYLYQYVFQFNADAYTPEIVNRYGEIIIELLRNNHHVILRDCENSSILFEYLLEHDCIDLACKHLNKDLLTDEMIEQYCEKIAPHLTSIPFKFSSNKTLFQYYLDQKNFDMLSEFDKSLWTDEFINSHLEEIANEMRKNPNSMVSFRSNGELFRYCVEHGMIDVAARFSMFLITEDFISKYKEEILKAVEEYDQKSSFSGFNVGSFLQFPLDSSKTLFEYFLSQQKYELLLRFSSSFITDDFLKQYAPIYANLCMKYDTVPYLLSKNDTFFHYCIQEKKWNLLTDFHKSLYQRSIFEQYGDIFYEALLRENSIPYFLSKNQSLFSLLLKKKDFNLLLKMDSSMITQDVVNQYKADILETLSTLGTIPHDVSVNPLMFDLILQNKDFHLLLKFESKLLNDDIVFQYGDEILKVLTLEDFNNYKVRHNIALLKLCIEKERFDLVIRFDDGIFQKKVLEECGEKVVEVLRGMGYIPTGLSKNRAFLNYCVEHGHFDVIVLMHSSIFTPDFCAKYGDRLVKEVKLYGEIPELLAGNTNFLVYCLVQKQYDILSAFSTSAFTHEVLEQYKNILIDYIENYRQGDIPECLSGCTELFTWYRELGKIDRIYQLTIPMGVNDEELESYLCDILGLSKEEYQKKIQYLLAHNDEIYNTLCVGMLNYDLNCIDLKHIEKLGIYGDIQKYVMSLPACYVPILGRILDILDQEEYDLTAVSYYIFQNMLKYSTLLDSIDVSTLNDEQTKNLIYILMRKENIYGITDIHQLSEENFASIKKNHYQEVSKRMLRIPFEKGTESYAVELAKLKKELFEKRYGLSMEMAQFIVQRYCHDMDMLAKSDLSKDVITILSAIYKDYQCDSIEELTVSYLTATTLITDFYSTISLESTIRKEYAKKFNDTLYHVQEGHRLKEGHELATQNREVYDLIMNAQYHGQKPTFYLLDGDFNMQIHALGAYSSFEVPKDFKEDWERPKIVNHGICTSYIGNNHIANARARHPIYGFTDYEESALLCAGNYDLVSKRAIKEYATSVAFPYRFFPPKEMINATRHTHNELVLERRSNRKGDNFKRKPSYVVYLVDDINNAENFSPDNELFQETVQAAIDQGLPIVVVDRLKYAKQEYAKTMALAEDFITDMNPSTFEAFFQSWMNNNVGCRKYPLQKKSEYHDYFSISSLEVIYDRMLTAVKTSNLNIEKKMGIIETMMGVLKHEKGLDTDNFLQKFHIDDKLAELERIKQVVCADSSMSLETTITK